MKKLLTALLCIALLGGCSNPQKDQYDQAKEYMANSKYDDAVEILEELGDYKDSAELLREASYQYALDRFERRQYLVAVEYFEKCGDYEDAAAKVEESKLEYVKYCVETKTLKDDAIALLNELIDAGNTEAKELYDKWARIRIRPEFDDGSGKTFATEDCKGDTDCIFVVAQSVLPQSIDDVSYSITMDDGRVRTGHFGTIESGYAYCLSEKKYVEGMTLVINGKEVPYDVIEMGGEGWFNFPRPATYEFYDGDGNLIDKFRLPDSGSVMYY